MPKITEEDLVTIQLRLFRADHEVLKRLFSGQVGVNKAIRTIIRAYVRQAEARANLAIDTQEGASAASAHASTASGEAGALPTSL